MTKAEILQGVEVVAHECLDRPGTLRRDTDLIDDLELDSLLLLTLAIEVENRFQICLEQEDEAAIRTVGDLVETIHRKLEAEAR
jgi:acyl carrier protein